MGQITGFVSVLCHRIQLVSQPWSAAALARVSREHQETDCEWSFVIRAVARDDPAERHRIREETKPIGVGFAEQLPGFVLFQVAVDGIPDAAGTRFQSSRVRELTGRGCQGVKSQEPVRGCGGGRRYDAHPIRSFGQPELAIGEFGFEQLVQVGRLSRLVPRVNGGGRGFVFSGGGFHFLYRWGWFDCLELIRLAPASRFSAGFDPVSLFGSQESLGVFTRGATVSKETLDTECGGGAWHRHERICFCEAVTSPRARRKWKDSAPGPARVSRRNGAQGQGADSERFEWANSIACPTPSPILGRPERSAGRGGESGVDHGDCWEEAGWEREPQHGLGRRQ